MAAERLESIALPQRRLSTSPEVLRIGSQSVDCTHLRATTFIVLRDEVVAVAPKRAHACIFNCIRALTEAKREDFQSISEAFGVCFHPRFPNPDELSWFAQCVPHELEAMREATMAGCIWQDIDIEGVSTSVITFWVEAPKVTFHALKLIAQTTDLNGRTYIEFLDSERPVLFWPSFNAPRTPSGLPSAPEFEIEIPACECGRFFGELPRVGPRTLVLPDLHHKFDRADEWLKRVQPDSVVLLGDSFDAREDSPDDARRMALWLKQKLHDPRFVCLWSNHDLPYGFPGYEEVLYCPGFTMEKAHVIREILGGEDWRRLKVACVVKGWLLSHGGFHPAWGKRTMEEILARCAIAEERAACGELDPILAEGEPPGLGRLAGPIWHSFEHSLPFAGLRQLVGHSAGDTVRIRVLGDAITVCIDVRGAVAAVLCQGRLHALAL